LQLPFDRITGSNNNEKKLLLLVDDDGTNSRVETPDATDNRTLGLINTDNDYLDGRAECQTQKCRTLTIYNNNNNNIAITIPKKNVDNNSTNSRIKTSDADNRIFGLVNTDDDYPNAGWNVGLSVGPSPSTTTTTTTTTTAETPNNIPKGVIVPIDDDVLKGMTCPKLKIELKLRNETVGGNKNELVARLRSALLKPKYTTEELELVRNATKKKAPAKNTTSGLKSFPTTAWWRPLIPNEEVLVDPTNPSFNNKVRPPTVEHRDIGKVFGKHNFDEHFDIPLYATMDPAHQQRRGRDVYVMKNGKRVPVYEQVLRKKGRSWFYEEA